MAKLDTKWTDERASSEIRKRLQHCKEARAKHEQVWESNERILYSTENMDGMSGYTDNDGDPARINVPYLMKNVRFIHAQMSSNPPATVMRPATSDQEDQRRAEAADKVGRHSFRKYNLQERVDQWSLPTIAYGTGILKTIFDSSIGDVLEYDEKTGEVELEGDISVTTPSLWSIYIDPDARSIDQIKYIIETIYMDVEEAIARWPEHSDALRGAVAKQEQGSGLNNRGTLYNSVELYEYWETGLASNGYLGRFCIITKSGTVVERCRPSPFRFRQAGAAYKIHQDSSIPDGNKEDKLAKLMEVARLPYIVLTDIDVPNQVYGKSFVEYSKHIQQAMNNLDSSVMDNLQAHGSPKLVVSDLSTVDDTMSNSPWDILQAGTGVNPPHHMQMPSIIAPGASEYRRNLLDGLNDTVGVNESMFGQQSREQAAAAMQFATNQGNLIRRRLFNKFALGVEQLYRNILDLARKHWTTAHTVQVLGKEKALDTVEIKGTDIDGGYDVVAEYGTAFSLDPIARRQELLMLQPLFKEAGIPTRRILSLLKLSELEVADDELELADSRQREIFVHIIATEQPLAPEPFMDHENMVAYALRYFMTSEFNLLPKEVRDLCKQHIADRIQLAAAEKQGMVQVTGGPLPQPGVEAVTAGPVPSQPAEVPQVAPEGIV